MKYLSNLDDRLPFVQAIAQHNVEALALSVDKCLELGIGDFRINSQFLPCYTHPEMGYQLEDLGGLNWEDHSKKIRLSFHPDQFVVLNSPTENVVEKSIAELEYQGQIAQLVGADVINLHGGGVYGDKKEALERFCTNFQRLSDRVKERLTLENDDRSYTPRDLIPVCKKLGIPLVYDVHHHRCNEDGWSVQEATKAALETWNREPMFHLSSPREGWDGKNPRPHADYIDVSDLPDEWFDLSITIEVEAKAKELAVTKLQRDLDARLASAS